MLIKVFQVYKLRETLKMLVLQRIDDSDFDSASSKGYIDPVVKDEKIWWKMKKSSKLGDMMSKVEILITDKING